MPGTQSIREQIRDLIDAEPTTGRSGEVADQILSLIRESELPTLDQMQDLINMAYQLGWRDREVAIVSQPLKQPPTVTLIYEPGEGTTFLYDGKPRPESVR